MRMRLFTNVLTGVLLLAGAAPVAASESGLLPVKPIHFGDVPAPPSTLQVVRFAPKTVTALTLDVATAVAAAAAAPQTPVGPPPFEYSDGYRTRATIHKWASWAMLPLFGLEAYLGQKMFNDVGEATDRNIKLHRSVAWGIGGLFAVNTFTGVPNLLEGRNDPNKSDLSLIHGVLMLVADAGFLATALTQPNSRTPAGLEIYTPKKNQHLTLAYASVSVATVGYLLALFGK